MPGVTRRRPARGTGLSFELWLALRYLRSTRADAFISLLSRNTAIGLTLGVAALVLALAALSGFQELLLTDLRSHTATLGVELLGADPVEEVLPKVASVEGVVAVQRMVAGRGWLRLGTDVEAVELLGFERRLPVWLPGARGCGGPCDLVSESAGVWLPASLAEQWLLSAGQLVEVVSPLMTLTPLGPQPRTRRLRVAGLYQPGEADERLAARLAMPLAAAQSLLGQTPTTLDVEVGAGIDEGTVAEELRSVLAPIEGARVVTWRDQHKALRFVLRLEKTVVFLAVALIVLVASFALAAALSLILSAKRQEVAVLAAMGAQSRSLQRSFLWLGAMLAVGGAVAGAALGALLAWSLDRFELLPLPGDVYLADHVPFLLRSADLIVVVAATTCVALTAAAIAARKADVPNIAEVLKQ